MDLYVIKIVNTIWLVFHVVEEINSSLSDPFKWIDEEVGLIEILQNYADITNERLVKLKKYEDTLIQHAKLFANEGDLVSNPLAIYKTVKHLTVDFEEIKEDMTRDQDNYAVTASLKVNNLFIPDEHRLYDEIRNLIYLQQMYNVTVAAMMEGNLAPNVNVERPALTTEDCFYIGKILAEKHDHETAIQWLTVCEDAYEDDSSNPVSAILVSSSLFAGDISLCRKTVDKFLRKDNQDRVFVDLQLVLSRKLGYWQDSNERDQWESFNICAGDYAHEVRLRNMTCQYNHHNSPFLIIAPLKEEVLSLVPRVVVFRDVVYDSEIDRIKSDSYSKLKPGRVLTGKGGTVARPGFFSSHRTTIRNMIPEYTNLRNRLMDMTSLSFTEKRLQVVYYVTGGFIRVHGDFAQKTEPSVQRRGHRIAQGILYLNDVILGGETVFPRLKVGIRPVKGSVAVWTNMRVDGSEEKLTDHAGCPVIYGEKIIGTQWFRMKGQDRYMTKPLKDELTLALRTDTFDRNIVRRKEMSRD